MKSTKKACLCLSYKTSDLDAARDFEREINLERTYKLPYSLCHRLNLIHQIDANEGRFTSGGRKAQYFDAELLSPNTKVVRALSPPTCSAAPMTTVPR
jgi:hypothetical protein